MARKSQAGRSQAKRAKLLTELLGQLEDGVCKILAERKPLLLESYRRELQLRAISLGRGGCWRFAEEKRNEAAVYGLERELERLAADAARKFASKCGQLDFRDLLRTDNAIEQPSAQRVEPKLPPGSNRPESK